MARGDFIEPTVCVYHAPPPVKAEAFPRAKADDVGAGIQRWYVECPWCHARGPTAEDKDSAIILWNNAITGLQNNIGPEAMMLGALDMPGDEE